VRGIVTFHLILITWVFFRAASLADATTILSRIVRSLPNIGRVLQVRLMNPDILLALALIAILLAVEALDETRPLWERVRTRPVAIRWAVYYAMLFALLVLGTWNLQQFVYMRF
jgi:hypothetical protein